MEITSSPPNTVSYNLDQSIRPTRWTGVYQDLELGQGQLFPRAEQLVSTFRCASLLQVLRPPGASTGLQYVLVPLAGSHKVDLSPDSREV